MSTINSSECEKCKYGSVDDSNKAKVMVHCDIKDKSYFYGQYVQCDIDNKERVRSE